MRALILLPVILHLGHHQDFNFIFSNSAFRTRCINWGDEHNINKIFWTRFFVNLGVMLVMRLKLRTSWSHIRLKPLEQPLGLNASSTLPSTSSSIHFDNDSSISSHHKNDGRLKTRFTFLKNMKINIDV